MILPGLIGAKPASGGGGYTGPLDIVPSAIGAYGNRALSEDKLGSALYTISDGEGGDTQVFNSDAVTGDAPIADIELFSATPFVTNWNDQGGSTHDLTAGNAAWSIIGASARPGVGKNVFGQFSGFFAVPANSEFTIFVATYVAALDVQSADVYSLFGEAGNFIEVYIGASSSYVSVGYADGGTVVNWESDVGTTGLHIWEVTVTSAGVASLWIDGVSQELTPDGAAHGNDADNYLIEMSNPAVLGGASSSSLNYEGLGWLTLVDASDRLVIRQNIADYYGITLP